jgi:uncharacterized protein (UPF0248 family)
MIKNLFRKMKYELQFNNTQYYTRITDKILKTYYRSVLQHKINTLKPITLNDVNSQLTIAILANKKNLCESLAALYSFCFWENNVRVHYHEDGTLNDNDILIIKKIFPGIVVFKKSEQTKKVIDMLLAKNLHNCAQLRKHFIFAVRLFDMLIEKKTPYLLQIDSDVLFFSKPTQILDIVSKGHLNGCFNQDTSNCYTFSQNIIDKYLPIPVLNNVNAGLFMHNFNEDFFAFTDNIIKNEPYSVSSWHLEQTLFAMYASLKGNFLALPKQYDLLRRERKAGNKIVSEHYCHNTGYNLHKDFIYKILPQYNI